jgi:hypothetical protein
MHATTRIDLMSTRLGNALHGVRAGLIATTAMSVALGLAHQVGTIDRQPAQLIVDALVPQQPEQRKNMLASVAHFGYGVSAAVAYAVAVPRAGWGLLSGTAYGALVWLGGYEGWLPAMGILPPAHRDGRNRVGTMVAAHLVFGAALGLVLHRQARR